MRLFVSAVCLWAVFASTAAYAASSYHAVTPATVESYAIKVRTLSDDKSPVLQVEVLLELDSHQATARRVGSLTVWSHRPELRDQFGVPVEGNTVRVSCNVQESQRGAESAYVFSLERKLVETASFMIGIQAAPGMPSWDMYELLVRDFVTVK